MNIFLSHLAERKIELLLEYLEEKWSRDVRNKFLFKLQQSFNQISDYPKSCQESQKFPNLFKCVLTKQTSYFYRINSNEIEIITLIDNRQNQDEIEKEIKKYFRKSNN